MILATCITLAAALANPASAGQVFALTQDCPAVAGRAAFTVSRLFVPAVTINAPGRTVSGIAIGKTGGGLHWHGGTITAPQGAGAGDPRGSPAYYGVNIMPGARDVSFSGVTFTDARKGIVNGGSNVRITYSIFTGAVEDGVMAAGGDGLLFAYNRAFDLVKHPARCTLPDGSIVIPMAKAACITAGGRWQDGWHSDVLQMRHGQRNVLAIGNVLDTTGQGLTQMDQDTDLPISNVRFHANRIRAGRHGLTLGRCSGCVIDGNTLVTAVPGQRAVILKGEARACGNVVPSGGDGREAC